MFDCFGFLLCIESSFFIRESWKGDIASSSLLSCILIRTAREREKIIFTYVAVN